MKKNSLENYAETLTNLAKSALVLAGGVLASALPWSQVLIARATTNTLQEQLEDVKPTIVDTNQEGTNVLLRVAARVVNIILLIAGILAVIYLVWAGIVYITAGGDTAKADKGRVGIVNALIGLVVIAAAFLLIRFVTGAVIGLENDPGSSVPIF